MNRQRAVDALIDITVKELLKEGNQVFLAEFVRNGFPGVARMSDQRLEQELVYRGLQDCWIEEYSWEDDDDFDDDNEPDIAIRNSEMA